MPRNGIEFSDKKQRLNNANGIVIRKEGNPSCHGPRGSHGERYADYGPDSVTSANGGAL